MTRRRVALTATFALVTLAVVWLSFRSIPPSPWQSADQEDALFRSFAAQNQGKDFAEFTAFLRSAGVDSVVPIKDVLRADARWRRCKSAPFTLPPREFWPNMVATLRYVRDDLAPVIGPVSVVSGFRSSEVNKCFKGAKASRHLRFAALDMEPVRPLERADLVDRLCRLHRTSGRANAVGLGIYDGVRFHIDTAGFRTWGRDYRGASSPCRG